MTPDQCREARRLLGWSRDAMTERTGLAVSTIAKFEGGHVARRGYAIAIMRRVFGEVGIEFIESEDGAPGVVLRKAVS